VREQVERLEHDPDPAPIAVISSPSMTMRPPSIGSSRLMQRRSVDLPDPDAPIRQTTSCSATSRSIPRSTASDPNDFSSPSTWSAGAALAGDVVGGDPVGWDAVGWDAFGVVTGVTPRRAGDPSRSIRR
jgi:hypothetical protein